MSDAPTFRDRIEYAFYLPVAFVLNTLPERWALGFGSALGLIFGGLFRIRWRVSLENLSAAFPESDTVWRRRVARASYRHLGREAVAMFRLGRLGPDEIRARTHLEGLDVVERALQEEGVIGVSGHFGSWEMLGAAVAVRGIPIDAVAVRQRNGLIDREILGARERLGIGIIDRRGATSQTLRTVGAGRILGLVADQDAGRAGVFVSFLGRRASTARGPALLALKTGARLFAGVALVEPGRPHRYVVHWEEIRVDRTGDLDEDVRRITQAHTAVLERFVRQAPEQYFWQHKRWKTQPDPDVE